MMKKLISIFCVIAMLCSFAVTVNAADNGFSIVKVSQDANSATYDIYLDTTTALYGFNIYLDMAAAITAGVPNSSTGIAVTAANGTTAKYASKLIAVSYANTTGEESAMFTSNKIATFVLDTSAITAAFDITQSTKRSSSVKKYVDGEGTIDITSDYTFDLAVTVEPFSAAFEPETVKGTAVEASATEIELDKDPATSYKNKYTNVALFTATLGADVNYSETGFIFVKDGVEGKGLEKMADGNAITGKGTFEYSVAMYGIPTGEVITAIPYYITAE